MGTLYATSCGEVGLPDAVAQGADSQLGEIGGFHRANHEGPGQGSQLKTVGTKLKGRDLSKPWVNSEMYWRGSCYCTENAWRLLRSVGDVCEALLQILMTATVRNPEPWGSLLAAMQVIHKPVSWPWPFK